MRRRASSSCGSAYDPKLSIFPDAGVYHGGVIASLIDVAGAVACGLPLGRPTPTANFRVDFLKSPAKIDLIATGRLVRSGRDHVGRRCRDHRRQRRSLRHRPRHLQHDGGLQGDRRRRRKRKALTSHTSRTGAGEMPVIPQIAERQGELTAWRRYPGARRGLRRPTS